MQASMKRALILSDQESANPNDVDTWGAPLFQSIVDSAAAPAGAGKERSTTFKTFTPGHGAEISFKSIIAYEL